MSAFVKDIECKLDLFSALLGVTFRKMIDGLSVDPERQFLSISMDTGQLDCTGMIKALRALAESFKSNGLTRFTDTNKKIGGMVLMPICSLPKAALNEPQEACMSSWKSPKGNA